MVFTGDELLRGDVVNSNQAFLGERLLELGLLPTRALSLLDDRAAIALAIREALGRRPSLIVVSGGLGPTEDDLTREGVSDALQRPLSERPELLELIRARFERLQVQMVESNRKQALLPAGATAIPFTGTAPGFWLEEDGTLLVALPGVPAELRHMWRETVEPLIRDRHGEDGSHLVRKLRIYGMGESTLAGALQDLTWRGGRVELGTRASLDGLTLVLRSRREARALAELTQVEGHVRRLLGDKVFAEGAETMPEVVGRLLRERGLRLAVAESCTGGLLGKLVTDVPGSSEYFEGGVICYSNSLKSRLLGVPEEVLARAGAVSEETALAMAAGARDRLGADVALAVTGVAGPDGGTEEKPVGLVYIGMALGEELSARRYLLFTSREDIRMRAAYTALNVLRRRLLQG
jgi:nicotinamide-nucleotide amidase